MLAKLHYKHGGITYLDVPDMLQTQRTVGLSLRVNHSSIIDAEPPQGMTDYQEITTFYNHGTEELFNQPTLILKEI